MMILGIDPGTAIVGWAVIEYAPHHAASSVCALGQITTPAHTPLPHRLSTIAHDLDELITRYKPDEAAVEELFFAANTTTAMSVAHARGAILLTLLRRGLTIGEYTPLEVKQALTGYGRADKRQMQEMVKAVFHLPTIPKPDDAADALAIAFCHSTCKRTHALSL